jgi:hypothetical protein
MAVFPERMKPLDPNNSQESLKTIENYIRYMTERMEFTHSNDNKVIAESVPVLEDRLGQLEQTVELLQEQISS